MKGKQFEAHVLLERRIYPKSAQTLMRLNVKEAAKFEKMLIATYHTYLQTKVHNEYMRKAHETL